MAGARLKITMLTAIVALSAGAAQGADYPQPLPPPPQPIYVQPPQQEFTENWYLRGYVGVGMNGKYDLDYQTTTGATLQSSSFSDTNFVGAGIGGSYNSLVDFTDVNPTGGFGFGRNPSEWHTAWALYAGVGYNISKTLKVDLTYRYLNYGSITDTVDCIGGCNPDSYKFGKLYSHDFMIGLRWICCEVAPAPRYVYAPPPPPPPPPLQSKG